MTDSLFKRPNPQKRASTKAGPDAAKRGRPLKHAEDWSKVTVVLFDRQIAYLDRLALDMRAKTKTPVTRAEIIRALVDFLEQSGADVTATQAEQDITEALLSTCRPKK